LVEPSGILRRLRGYRYAACPWAKQKRDEYKVEQPPSFPEWDPAPLALLHRRFKVSTVKTILTLQQLLRECSLRETGSAFFFFLVSEKEEARTIVVETDGESITVSLDIP
jgi:hypothetical protein